MKNAANWAAFLFVQKVETQGCRDSGQAGIT
jgi:hypothetical protein